MKNTRSSIYAKLTFLCFCLLSGTYAFAQDNASHSSSTVTTTSSVPDPNAWYMAPWVWVVGAVVLLLLLYALFSGRNTRTDVTRTTTITEVKD